MIQSEIYDNIKILFSEIALIGLFSIFTAGYQLSNVDLVDMTRKPSGGYKYIIPLMDLFSKFHLLGSLVQKTQAEVLISVPAILHTDNGSEFGALDRLLQQWPGSSDIVH
ncbi:hypothetical protein ACJMK2_018705 [Sinanodonta woodiana]|uniref:Integrase catalytic domain-containing protein n=1 Tax=Sinanodonta woodiana TaxID=1069815 RepID=A0ABD3UHA7_SINWO